MSLISLVMPFYRNPGMLALQYEGWAAWPDDLKARWEIVLVDDGSPEAAIDVHRPEGLPALRIYRVLEDRPWHQHGARNLGAFAAATPWLLLTDMDHVLRRKYADRLVRAIDAGAIDGGTCYMMARREADTGEPTLDRHGRPKPHPNSFVMAREHYWRIGGYDEDYCGTYGTDGLFRRRAFDAGGQGFLKDVVLTRYWRELVPDASTRTLQRKEGRAPGAKQAIRDAKVQRGDADCIKVMQFPWKRVL